MLISFFVPSRPVFTTSLAIYLGGLGRGRIGPPFSLRALMRECASSGSSASIGPQFSQIPFRTWLLQQGQVVPILETLLKVNLPHF